MGSHGGVRIHFRPCDQDNLTASLEIEMGFVQGRLMMQARGFMKRSGRNVR